MKAHKGEIKSSREQWGLGNVNQTNRHRQFFFETDHANSYHIQNLLINQVDYNILKLS